MFSFTKRLECSLKSPIGSKKQPTVEATSAHTETHKPNDTVTKKTITDKLRVSLPGHSLPCSVQETSKTGSLREDVLNTEVCSPKESGSITPRVKQADSAAVPGEELQIKTQLPAVTGKTLAFPLVKPLPRNEANKDDKLTREENTEDEDLKAPVELIMEFLRAMMDRDFQMAIKLCQMILIYEPDNAEASEFLPLIRKKLLEAEDTIESTDEDEEDHDDDIDDDDDDEDSEDSGSDEDTSTSSSGSSSSSENDEEEEEPSSSLENDEEEEKKVNRHKPCPPSQVSP
ncbi:glutamate-rich protein 2 isoform X2 [Channa argus]|uniref:glutamate-rich protein 2 isoform X2 n=1 Tax=Channa argus TaxID=215402 RepID=UPI003520839C